MKAGWSLTTGACLIALTLVGAAHGQAVGDPVLGETVFKKCADCHAVGEGARNRVGPVLNGVVGRQAGTYERFKYSKAMIDAGTGGLVWSPETLGGYLANPGNTVKGTKMAFPGLQDEADRNNVIAYLLSFSPDFVPAP